MPMVQFRNEVDRINITKNMPHPKRVGDIKAWFKGCRSVVPEIPNCYDSNAFWRFASDPDISIDWIRWDIVHKVTAHRCYIVVNRSQRMPTF